MAGTPRARKGAALQRKRHCRPCPASKMESLAWLRCAQSALFSGARCASHWGGYPYCVSNGRKAACPLLWLACLVPGSALRTAPCHSNFGSVNEPTMIGSLFVGVYNGDRSIGAANLRKGFTPSMEAALPLAGAPCAPFYGSAPRTGLAAAIRYDLGFVGVYVFVVGLVLELGGGGFVEKNPDVRV